MGPPTLNVIAYGFYGLNYALTILLGAKPSVLRSE